MSPSKIDKIKFFSKIFALCCAGLGLFAVLLFALVVKDLPHHRIRAIAPDSAYQVNEQQGPSALESGSRVKVSDLEVYLGFAKLDQSAQDWLNEHIQSRTVEKAGSYFDIEQAIDLPPVLLNDCPKIQCYQHRVPFSKIPSLFWKGLINIEDIRFLDHKGIDPISIGRSFVVNLKRLRFAQGGSTLTQQLVRNLFLTNEKTLKRKIVEMVYSIYIDAKYSKEEILEAYFNEVFWGVMGGVQVKGVHSAARFYFNKQLSSINSFEAMILVSMLQGPMYYHPLRHLDRLKKRSRVLYDKLVELNILSSKVDPIWNESAWNEWEKDLEARFKTDDYFNFIISQRNLNDGASAFDKFVLVQSGEEVLQSVIERVEEKNFAYKVYFQNLKSNQVVTAYSKYERNLEVAINEEKHQVGSTLKPIIYSVFLMNGKSPDDEVPTVPIELDLKSGKWSPREAHDVPEKTLPLREALAKSLNRPVIHLAQELGWEKVEDEVRQFGIDLKSPLAEYPSQLLGAVELSVSQLGHAFENLFQRECEYDPQVGNDVMGILSDPKQTTIGRTVGDNMGKMRFFGKTGTSNAGLDNWFIFFDGLELGVFWFGWEGPRTDKKFPLYGSSTAFQIVKRFLNRRGRRISEVSCGAFIDSSAQKP